MLRGSSFRKESRIARERMALSASDFFLIEPTGSMDTSKSLSCIHQQMFKNRPETQSWEKRKSANDQNGRDQQTSKQPTGYRECTGRFWNHFLFRQAPGNGEHRDDHEEPAEEVSGRCRRVGPHGVCADPAERRAMIPRRLTI